MVEIPKLAFGDIQALPSLEASLADQHKIYHSGVTELRIGSPKMNPMVTQDISPSRSMVAFQLGLLRSNGMVLRLQLCHQIRLLFDSAYDHPTMVFY